MKIALLAAAAVAVQATEEAYAKPQKYGKYEHYGNDAYNYHPKAEYQYGYEAHRGPAIPAYYGASPYAPEEYYDGYGHTPDYVEPAYPQKQKPNPFVDYPPEDKNTLRIPHLAQYHCFLNGAPWTKCGRKSLTSYFMQQCMNLYYSLSTNVDGICGGKPPADPAVDPYGSYYDEYYQPTEAAAKYMEEGTYKSAQPAHSEYYGHKAQPAQSNYYGPQAQPANQYYAPTAQPAEQYKPTPAPATIEKGYSGALMETYQRERCLQNSYISITSVMVMCLTENMIRIKFIEHYAKNAATNPIEGPMLYLKKLHQFIKQVVKCNGRKAKGNFPNLWVKFVNNGIITYNPNAPYELDSDNNVILPQYTNGESSGFNDIHVNDLFICNNVEDILPRGKGKGKTYGLYKRDPANPHYKPRSLRKCRKSQALKTIDKRAYRICKYDKDVVRGKRQRKGPYGSDIGGYADLDMAGLYNAVNPVTTKTTSAFRVRSIAEVLVYNSGLIGQPLLEGFGIMYFCAFYACKANNGGDLDGTCFPTFDADKDWKIPSGVTNFAKLNKLGDKVEYCLAKKWITKDDVAECSDVQKFQKLLDRSYICMAERSVVKFFNKMTRDDRPRRNDAWDLVYFRHLATEKCYEEKKLCTSNKKLYEQLVKTLTSLIDTCHTRKVEYKEKKSKHSNYYGGNHHYYPAYPNAQPAANRYQ